VADSLPEEVAEKEPGCVWSQRDPGQLYRLSGQEPEY